MKKTPPSRLAAPVKLDFVMARVFDLYRELATPGRTAPEKAASVVRSLPRKQRGTLE